MEPENYTYREYQIQITLHDPLWEAAIYPTKPDMLEIDWETQPIRAANVMGALALAKTRIDMVLSGSL
jgi:hypothetical protein